MHLVLGVEDTDDVAPAFAQCGVERLRLVLGQVVVHDHPDDARVACRRRTRDKFCLRVVMTDDHDHLVLGVVEPSQRVDRVPEDILFVASR